MDRAGRRDARGARVMGDRWERQWALVTLLAWRVDGEA